jgi:hypothetical protein
MPGLTTFDQLLAFLAENKFPHAVDRAHQVVELPSKAAPLPGNLLVRWEKRLPFVQFIQFMIDDIPEARLGELEGAIARINCALEVPGLGLDHARRRLYFRLTMPVFAPEGIAPTTFHRMGQACVAQAKDLRDAFQAVVDGQPGAEIERIAREKHAARPQAEGGSEA